MLSSYLHHSFQTLLKEMGAGALAICQSKSAVRLKEDVKKIAAAAPLSGSRAPCWRRVFGVALVELQQQGLSRDGVPTLVRDIAEFLIRHGLAQEGLFRVNGSLKTVEHLRAKYENGEDVDLPAEGDVSSAASLLKLFLRELPEGVITSALHPRFIQLYEDVQNSGRNVTALRELLKQLPEAHYCLLKYLCQFLRKVAEHHSENRMTVSNLATVFGPNCFHVSSGFEGMKEQEICNKIMAHLLEDYTSLFEWQLTKEEKEKHPCEELAKIILVKVAVQVDRMFFLPQKARLPRELDTPASNSYEVSQHQFSIIQTKVRANEVKIEASCQRTLPIILSSCEREMPKPSPRNKITKSKHEGSSGARTVPQPKRSEGIPRVSIHVTGSLCSEEMDLADEVSLINSTAFFNSSQEDERPMSPFYLSAHVPQANSSNSVPASGEYLEKTIRSAVEQHLFDVHGSGGQSSEDSESGTSSTSSNVSARQRRRHHKEQEEARRNRDMEVINKENIPSGFNSIEECMLTAQDVEKLQENSSGYIGERSKPKRQKSSTKLSELNDNQDSPLMMESFGSMRPLDRRGPDDMEVLSGESRENENDGDSLRHSQNASMKIQEHPSIPEARLQRSQEADTPEETFGSEVPQLDLTALCSESSWEEPVPAFSSWQRDGLDSDEARLSPQAGRLIQQLLDENSDPMLSPRFYAYGQSRQYLDDTEVPPSPPNAHSFMRRRSSSLGSHEDDQEDLTPAQLTRRIQGLKKKIRRFEERFEEERKYRPSHSDKAANLEVLKWTNDLAKFRKQLKESRLKMSEDLAPMMRQRSNTLPKSFGSQLEKEEEKKPELPDKSTKPAVEATLEAIQKKLQERRSETNRPEDIKDMTRDQIAAEKVALQKALLNYESIHGRPVTKHERQMMKPLYDRYRLVKQILSRANSIPSIGSPSSKRRSPLLQPIIEGETASFFKEIKEEEDGSEEDSNVKPDFTVTIKSDFNVRSFLDQLEDDADGFVSPVDDRIPSRSSQDMGLSNLHAASMPELVEQLQEVREEKKRIRKKLRDFEDNFFRQNGRNVQKEDRTPMAEEYNEYKQVKAKLRLLEVLISKRDMSSKIM